MTKTVVILPLALGVFTGCAKGITEPVPVQSTTTPT